MLRELQSVAPGCRSDDTRARGWAAQRSTVTLRRPLRQVSTDSGRAVKEEEGRWERANTADGFGLRTDQWDQQRGH